MVSTELGMALPVRETGVVNRQLDGAKCPTADFERVGS